MHQWSGVVLEDRLQLLDQHLGIQPLDAQVVQDGALCGLNQPPPVLEYPLQPLAQPGPHGLQQLRLSTEKSGPHLGQEATQQLQP